MSFIMYVLGFSLAFADPLTSHEQAAKDMLDCMNMGETFSKTIDSTLDLQIQQNPALKSKRKAMKTFFDRYMSWASLEGDFIKIYTESFTEDELKQLTAFYNTPVGKKSVRLMPEMTRKGGEIGNRRGQENMHELVKLLEETE